MITLFILVLLFAAADRFSGGGLGWQKLSHDGGGPLRGRGIGYAMIVMAIVFAVILQDWRAAALAIPFGIWRSPPWKIGGAGGIAPITAKDAGALFVRHLLALSIVPFAYWFDLGWKTAGIGAVVFAAGATALGWWHGQETAKGRDVNPTVELIRGALFGLMMWAMIAL